MTARSATTLRALLVGWAGKAYAGLEPYFAGLAGPMAEAEAFAYSQAAQAVPSTAERTFAALIAQGLGVSVAPDATVEEIRAAIKTRPDLVTIGAIDRALTNLLGAGNYQLSEAWRSCAYLTEDDSPLGFWLDERQPLYEHLDIIVRLPAAATEAQIASVSALIESLRAAGTSGRIYLTDTEFVVRYPWETT